MYVRESDGEILLKEMADQIGGKMFHANQFLSQLIGEDDWSFVIKSHALIEASITELVTSALGDKDIRGVVENLPLSDIQTGKIAFAKNLGLLDSRQISFIRWFSELRNDLVHNVEKVDFQFKEHWATLDQNQKKSWKIKIGWSIKEGESPDDFYKLVQEKTKIAVWLSIFSLITICESHIAEARFRKDLSKASESATTEYLKIQEKLIDAQSSAIRSLSRSEGECSIEAASRKRPRLRSRASRVSDME